MDGLNHVFEWVALVIDGGASLVMVWGFATAAFGFVRVTLRAGPEKIHGLQLLRCDLGVNLVFALELMIIADLLHTVVSRTMEDLLVLGTIVVIRTVISFFLDREIREMRAEASE